MQLASVPIMCTVDVHVWREDKKERTRQKVVLDRSNLTYRERKNFVLITNKP